MKKKMCLVLAAVMLSATVFTTTYNKQQKLFLDSVESKADPITIFTIIEIGAAVVTIGLGVYEIYQICSSSSSSPTTQWLPAQFDLNEDGTYETSGSICVYGAQNDGCAVGTAKTSTGMYL